MSFRAAARVRDIQPSATLGLAARASAMAAEGRDVVNLAVGEPDFDSPKAACDGAVEAIRAGYHGYTPAIGLPRLREAVCSHYERRHGLEIEPREVVITSGGKHALYNLCQVLLDPGDEMLIPAPYWVSYPAMAQLAQAVPRIVETRESEGFSWRVSDFEAARGPRTKLVMLNSPSNPTGTVQSPETIAKIAAWAREHGLYVISDEIYEDLTYDGAVAESWWKDPARRPDSALVSGMSKSFAMTGWRLGWLCAEPAVVSAVSKLQSHSTSNPSAPAQYAAIAALEAPKDYLADWQRIFDTRRRLMIDGLEAVDGIRLSSEPKGAFYVFPDLSGLLGRKRRGEVLETVDDIAEALLEDQAVVAVPGAAFGAPTCIRMSYAASEERLQTALQRIAAFVKSLD